MLTSETLTVFSLEPGEIGWESADPIITPAAGKSFRYDE